MGGRSVLELIEELDREEELEAQAWDASDDHVKDDLDCSTAGFGAFGVQRHAQAMKTGYERAMELCVEAGFHTVLMMKSLELLFPDDCGQPDGTFNGTYVDCTFGRGGHSRGILSRLSNDSRLYSFDLDTTVSEFGDELAMEDERFEFFNLPFTSLDESLPNGMVIHGALLDVGLSNAQAKDRALCLSMSDIYSDRPLDLRMNPSAGVPASEWLMGVSVEELAWVLRTFGDVHDDDIMAERMAQAVVNEQQEHGAFTSIRHFAEVVARTRSFQSTAEEFNEITGGLDRSAHAAVMSLRLFMNREAEQLARVLPMIFERLAEKGRCLVSAFKPAQERVILRFMLDHEDPDAETAKRLGSRRLHELYPLVGMDANYSVKLVGNPIRPPLVETTRNMRMRSGAMYVLEKAPRLSKRVKAKPRLAKNRFKQPSHMPALVDIVE